MAGNRTVLIADDDPHIREVVRFALEKAGFDTAEATDGLEALDKVDEIDPDLVVLDIMMPEMDGTDVCRTLRSDSSVPIVFLSSKDDEIDRVVGLELGGDDYVTKPFSPRELVARVKAVLRRSSDQSNGSSGADADAPDREGRLIEHGKLRLDLDRYKAFWEDSEVDLTKTEFGVLQTLMGFPGKVFSRNELMDGAYDHGTVVSDRTIDSHVRRVRRKFEEVGQNPIETVHGLGYKLGHCR